MTKVYKISENLRKEIIEHYKDTSVPNKPPYSVFQSKDCGTVVTLYESGKIMFQGISADIDYALWRDREKFLNNRNIDKEIKSPDKDKKKTDNMPLNAYGFCGTIGSDEVGTGDYFGPIVVTASYVSIDNIKFVESLGVKDSKKITDKKIIEIAPKLIKTIPHVTYSLNCEDYNRIGITNMNKVKSILHNKVLYNLVNKGDYDFDYIVVDQFAPPKKYFEHIKEVPNKITNIDFTTKAEDKCLSVAVSSIICRYIFLKSMKELNEKYSIEIPKGAGPTVDLAGVEFVKRFGFDELNKVCKLNFKNTEKIKKLI